MLVALALLGLPIGLSMIGASIFYLLVAGLDPGTAAEQILNGLYNSYVLLAVPLFILAADLMNTGSLTDRLLKFCLVLVGRFRGGLGHVNVVANIIFAGMSGSAIADAVGIGRIIIGMMTRDGKISGRVRRRDHRVGGDHRADHSAVDPDGHLRAGLRRVDRLPLPRRRDPGRCCSASPSWSMNTVIARRRNYPVEPRGAAARDSARHARGVSGAAAAGHPAVRHLRRRDDADRGRGRGRRVRAAGRGADLSRAVLPAALRRAALEREGDDLGRHADRGRAGLQLRGHDREHPGRRCSISSSGFHLSPVGFLLLVNAILLVLGCLLEGTTILLVIVPILIPTAKALGIDLVHFGVVVVVNIMIGLLTPPFGLLLFVVANMTKQPLAVIVRECAPFIVAAIVVLAIIAFVPDTILWLPRMLGYKG